MIDSDKFYFRGKDIHCGEWIYGSAVHQTDCYGDPVDHWYIVPPEASFEIIGDYSRVEKETVTQYTGIEDKNGDKIFEGDFVWGTIVSPWVKRKIICEVVYENGEYVAREKVYGGYEDHKVLFGKDVAVVGNKFDNPEYNDTQRNI